MRTSKVLRCSACSKRIRDHQPDLEVLEASTGRVRYYHTACGEMAFARAQERGGAWLCTVREADASRN